MSEKKIFRVIPKSSTENRQIEKGNKTKTVIDDPTLDLDMDWLFANYSIKRLFMKKRSCPEIGQWLILGRPFKTERNLFIFSKLERMEIDKSKKS